VDERNSPRSKLPESAFDFFRYLILVAVKAFVFRKQRVERPADDFSGLW
jgi:hypothetical protein